MFSLSTITHLFSNLKASGCGVQPYHLTYAFKSRDVANEGQVTGLVSDVTQRKVCLGEGQGAGEFV